MPCKETLETQRLILRPFEITDFEAVHSWAGNPENVRFMAWGPNTEKETREFLECAKLGNDFIVVLKESGEAIGSCGIYSDYQAFESCNTSSVESSGTGLVGWVLHMDHWKHGYGSELGRELIRYGFEDLNLRRIQAPCAAANYGSFRVMENSGMRREAYHQKAFWARVDKEWVDMVVYAILAEEYFSKPVS